MSANMLESERVIINSPMSFAGAAQRSWRIRKGHGLQLAAWTTLAALLLILWWAGVLSWYVVVFGLFAIVTIPYRLLRRGARKRKAERLRHRELMDAVQAERLAAQGQLPEGS